MSAEYARIEQEGKFPHQQRKGIPPREEWMCEQHGVVASSHGECFHCLQEQRDELLEALGCAVDDIQWMSGAQDFGPDGEAFEGWKNVHERLLWYIDLMRELQGGQ